VAVPRIIYTTSQNACVVSGNFVLLYERWRSGVSAVQPHGRRRYLRTACRRFEYLDELSPPGTFAVTVLYRLLEIIYFFTTLVAHDRTLHSLCIHRLMCAMPIRSSTSTACRMRMLWSWCTMILPTILSECYIIDNNLIYDHIQWWLIASILYYYTSKARCKLLPLIRL